MAGNRSATVKFTFTPATALAGAYERLWGDIEQDFRDLGEGDPNDLDSHYAAGRRLGFTDTQLDRMSPFALVDILKAKAEVFRRYGISINPRRGGRPQGKRVDPEKFINLMAGETERSFAQRCGFIGRDADATIRTIQRAKAGGRISRPSMLRFTSGFSGKHSRPVLPSEFILRD